MRDPQGLQDSAPASVSLNVVLVDPLNVVRAGLAMLIRTHVGMTVAGEASSAQDAVTVISELASKRDVVVVVGMDLTGDEDAYWLIRHLRQSHPTTRLLACGARSPQSVISRALFMGADGFADQCTDPDDFLAAIAACGRGETVITGACRNKLASIISEIGQQRDASELLSEREVEVLTAAASGATARQISGRLGVAERTVTTHLSRIYAKLGVSSRMAAVARAQSEGLLPSVMARVS